MINDYWHFSFGIDAHLFSSQNNISHDTQIWRTNDFLSRYLETQATEIVSDSAGLVCLHTNTVHSICLGSDYALPFIVSIYC